MLDERYPADKNKQLNRAFPDNPQYQGDLAWIEVQANAPIEWDPSP